MTSFIDLIAKRKEASWIPKGGLRQLLLRGSITVAKVGDDIVGAVIFSKKDNPRRIYYLAVHPHFRGMGIGSLLVETCGEELLSYVTEDSLEFWKRIGFKETGNIKASKGGKELVEVWRSKGSL